MTDIKWCEIFKTGIHTDSNGNTKNWTVEDLKKIENNFQEKNKDVPICCGHPKTNSPAYGWVDKLKISGESLFAAYKNVQPEFKEAVQKGLFKTRSISLTPDLVLRHVAFLGGQAPAVKGLEQFCFETPDEADITINFNANVETKIRGDLMDENAQKELDIKNQRIEELEAELEKRKQEKLIKEFEDFCDEAVKNGKILPVERESVMNILQACSKETLNFEDGVEKRAEDIFKSFINGLKRIDFEETATQKNVVYDNSVDFQSADSIRQGIILVQNEYKQKGIELSAQEALSVLEKKE